MSGEDLIDDLLEIKGDTERLDKYVNALYPDLSRSYIQQLISEGKITVDGNAVTPKYKAKSGSLLRVRVPKPVELQIEPEQIPLDIVYQDEDIAVINKAQGMVVHPAPGNYSGTLVNALLYQLDGLSGINGVIRPGIVHRIDKDTSGLLVVAKNDEAHQSLARQIKNKTAHRTYIALLNGNLKSDSGVIDAPIGRSKSDRKKMAVVSDGRPAATQYTVLERFENQYTLVEARLTTGRTHQIRVHFASMGLSVVGDRLYGPAKCPFHLKGQLLHAAKLELIHPKTGETMTFEAPLPDYFQDVLRKLRIKYGLHES